jgi:type IV secretory pathway VirB2 component (pilin)
MQIPIPRTLVQISDRIQDWGSQTLYGPFRRMDPVIAVTAVAVTGYSWSTGGWFPALQTAASFLFGVMAFVLLMPPEEK